MSPEAQRIAIAETRGWQLVNLPNHPNGRKVLWMTPEGVQTQSGTPYMLPNYLHDLNAMHEAIAYARANLRDMDGELFWCDGDYMVCAYMVLEMKHWDHPIKLTLITAPQYAEIFLRTLNLWTD